MAGPNRLQGTPWHVEKLGREEGDARRHRSRCKYYAKKEDGAYCFIRSSVCIGSAHCLYYKEGPSVIEAKTASRSKPSQMNSLHKKGVKSVSHSNKSNGIKKDFGSQKGLKTVVRSTSSIQEKRPVQRASSVEPRTEYVVGNVKYKVKQHEGKDPLSALYSDPRTKRKVQKTTKTATKKNTVKVSPKKKTTRKIGRTLISSHELHRYTKNTDSGNN